MSSYHMVRDLDAFRLASGRGIPFARAICGKVETRKNLVSVPDFVTCPVCRSLLPPPVAVSMTPSVSVENQGMEEEILGDLSGFDE